MSSSKISPKPCPNGPGRDGPKEINHKGEWTALDPIPPRISPQPEIEYFYNKVTKYHGGHKIEYNTTEDNEYINIQHGNDTIRLTFFKDGNIEIIQEDGDRLDEVNGDFKVDVKKKYEVESKIHNLKQNTYKSESTQSTHIKSGGDCNIESGRTNVISPVSISGDVAIQGTLTVSGSLSVGGILVVGDGIYGKILGEAGAAPPISTVVAPSQPTDDIPDIFETSGIAP